MNPLTLRKLEYEKIDEANALKAKVVEINNKLVEIEKIENDKKNAQVIVDACGRR